MSEAEDWENNGEDNSAGNSATTETIDQVQADDAAVAEPAVTAEKAASDDVHTAALNEFNETSDNSSGMGLQKDLDVVLDIPVKVSMEVGHTQISIRDLIQLNQGSVIELDRLAGEPLDVMVNGTLIAQGEVVVVNEKFGIRITDVVSPSERLKKLK